MSVVTYVLYGLSVFITIILFIFNFIHTFGIITIPFISYELNASILFVCLIGYFTAYRFGGYKPYD